MQAKPRLSKFSLVEPSLSYQDKLSRRLSSMNKPLSIYPYLLQSAQASFLRLYLPETLLFDGNQLVFLFSDSCGTVRVVKGDMVRRSFLTMSEERIKQLRKFNPEGLNFPRFITFRGEKQSLWSIIRQIYWIIWRLWDLELWFKGSFGLKSSS